MNSSSEGPMSRAPFLVFEGLDGSGKSTLMAAIVNEVQRRGGHSVVTREPGGTPLAEEIRGLLLKTEGEAPVPETELLLYAASRSQHVAGVIAPALKNGAWVLCDRFSPSSVAFQSFARGLDRSSIDWLNSFAQQGVEPDLIILLDLTVDESRRRQGARTQATGQAADRMEREACEFHERVRLGYLTQSRESPDRWLVLDATRTPEELQATVIRELERRQWLR